MRTINEEGITKLQEQTRHHTLRVKELNTKHATEVRKYEVAQMAQRFDTKMRQRELHSKQATIDRLERENAHLRTELKESISRHEEQYMAMF